MENRIIDILLEIKSEIGVLKKGQIEIKEGVDKLDGRVCKVEDDISELGSEVAEIKTTVNALSDALIITSKEVKQLKGQP